MKPKTMILLVVAVTCGLGASYMTSKLLAERKGPPPEEKVKVLVAKAKVSKYTVLKEPEKFFEQREMPKAIAPKSFFSELAEIKDKRVNKEFKADVHISPEDVADRLSGLPIPDGFGSIGLKVTADKASSYFITPGDKVDVIWTQRGDNPASRTLLRDVLVLSVADRTTKPGEQDSSVIQAQTVNLAVSAKDASRIALAEEHGQLRLRLLKEGDVREPDSSSVTLNDLKLESGTSSSPALPPVPGKKQPEQPKEDQPAAPAWVLEIKEGNRDSRRFSFWADGRAFPEPIVKDGEKKKDKKDDVQPEQDPTDQK